MAIDETHIPLPSVNRPWFLIPADDSGAFYYFVMHMLSSKHRKQRFIIKFLRISIRCGGARFWPAVAKWIQKINSIRNV
jgi:hypothetical protein